MKYPVPVNVLSISGYLQPFNLNITFPFKSGLYTQRNQKVNDRLCILTEINLFTFFGLSNKSEVQISCIMKNSPSTRNPSDNRDIILSYETGVYFPVCHLVLAYDDRRIIDTQYKVFFFSVLQKHLLKCQIEVWVMGLKDYAEHTEGD